MADPYGTEPMFDVPEKYRPPLRPVKYPQWRRYSGKRTSCDVCIIDLSMGTVKFMAESARHVRTDENGRRFLCDRHADERRVADQKGKR